MISVFNIFKIGIGPSSSHTVGPMKAAKQFIDELLQNSKFEQTTRIVADVYGSLALTGRGHNTDTAIVMGLMGYLPDNVDIAHIDPTIRRIKQYYEITLNEADAANSKVIPFNFYQDIPFHFEFLPRHENAMVLSAYHEQTPIYMKTFYSIGGGFIVDEAHFGEMQDNEQPVPYPYRYATDILQYCKDLGLSISGFARQNELALHSEKALSDYLLKIWQTMEACIQQGLQAEGLLPGPLKVVRRAGALHRTLQASQSMSNDPMEVIDWINLFALAVNEENAAGGRVVTAPTNGACGIVPAVLAYYEKFVAPLSQETIERYLLTTSLIGSLYKMNASISGAEVGCQGEVGVACSMAAAGLTEILGGSPEQVCTAAEIAMEHNLGLTCDPVGGQVQVPCIERNAIASVKAVNASRMALRRSGIPRVSLDKVIETMFETGKDMNAKYRETSTGGLAIKIAPCD
ncbi:L-serine dehydratase [Cricetibacter osteomyelitidis]|uniref:L-serine dehydratase n=1 Tax=Cricetibacter osteomyelitidis TaxID=1521931 RepID=A0A4R2SXX1_9PAST|nr:L-serine ammonia-lyase [Cricetibacter osteomyelitidis]TCP93506.1 L-serine dehydratase [Cricetibacter osteomyelitidis]